MSALVAAALVVLVPLCTVVSAVAVAVRTEASARHCGVTAILPEIYH